MDGTARYAVGLGLMRSSVAKAVVSISARTASVRRKADGDFIVRVRFPLNLKL